MFLWCITNAMSIFCLSVPLPYVFLTRHITSSDVCLHPHSFILSLLLLFKLESATCHISPSPFLFSIFLVCFITCHVLYKPSHSVSQKLRKANEQGDDLLKNSFHINLLEEIFQFPHSSCSCILLTSFFLYLSPPLCVS